MAETPTNSYFVDSIVEHKTNLQGATLYRVRWLGYNENDDTWEPQENFNDQIIVQNYINSLSESNSILGRE